MLEEHLRIGRSFRPMVLINRDGTRCTPLLNLIPPLAHGHYGAHDKCAVGRGALRCRCVEGGVFAPSQEWTLIFAFTLRFPYSFTL